MLIFTIGTTAEALKLLPLWKLMSLEKLDFIVLSLGQHPIEVQSLMINNGLDLSLIRVNSNDEKNLNSSYGAMVWFLKSTRNLVRLLIDFHRSKDIICIHGDTLSSLVGSIAARLRGFRIIHIEAGMRSHSLLNPFPEELIRRLTARLACFHFCPTEVQLKNLIREGIDEDRIRVTHGNTAIDNVSQLYKDIIGVQKEYGLVTLHRSELLGNSKKFNETLETISRLGLANRIIMVADHRAKIEIQKFSKVSKLNFEVHEKMEHEAFLGVLLRAKWVITDSGGLQQECAFLGIPTLIHRKSTESFEGFGQNLQMSNFQMDKIEDFVQNYQTFNAEPQVVDVSPSKTILEQCRKWDLI